MLEMDVIGWIVVGFLAGALSGVVVGGRTARGCLPNILIGVLGGLVGGWLSRELFGNDRTVGFIGAVFVAFVGAVLVRWFLNLAAPRDHRRR
ncbi:MAG: GlsB/YeaQ/YmgE family stress response membrane protein [Chloroflexi bacterium]|nr:GlsB/YeaQ/YmgE family stress response membrane protein [Chloroflexota bacterium]